MSNNELKWNFWKSTIFFVIVFNSICFKKVLADGNVGCLFSKSLCLHGVEFCYDDYAFGKCIPKYGIDVNELEREPLDEDQSHALALMLEEFQGAGLGWNHLYVQCRMQAAIFSLHNRKPLPPNLCAHLAPNPSSISDVDDSEDGNPIAIVHFTTPDNDFVDYYPPIKKSSKLFMEQKQPKASFQHFQQSDQADDAEQEQFNQEKFYTTSNKYPTKFDYDNFERASTAVSELQDDGVPDEEDLDNRIKDMKNRIELRRMLVAYVNGDLKPPIFTKDNIIANNLDEHPKTTLRKHYNQMTRKRNNNYGGYESDDDINDDYSELYYAPEIMDGNDDEPQPLMKQSSVTNLRDDFIRNQQYPKIKYTLPQIDQTTDYFRKHLRSGLFNVDNNNNNNNNNDDLSVYSTNIFNHHKFHNNQHNNKDVTDNADNELEAIKPEASGVYTEGGLVYVPGSSELHNREAALNRNLEARNLLANMLGFTRHERLDVKKPGPPAEPPPSYQSPNETPKLTENLDATKEILPEIIKTTAGGDIQKKTTQQELHSDDDHGPHSVDTEYTHVILKTPLDNWSDGKRIVSAIADMLNMKPYLSSPRVDRHEIAFKIEKNPDRKTAFDIAKAINDNRFKSNLQRRLGVTVIRAGIGDKVKEIHTSDISSKKIESSSEFGSDRTHLLIYMTISAGIAAILVIILALLLIRKQGKRRDKLSGLQAGISGVETCSKDYQDLCRARMAGKSSVNDSGATGRIASLSKENDRPPSSRSSTSSWSEEPALSNMDISTGHMVLSYMEDHLRNKNRLQREWDALCRYEAEPSARESALQEQCVTLNRSTAPLPFDHSRVVLNHLANAEGLDYINASTITDHDPRAPAYVAAQGPLPTTLAHFWQMIWEQGAVVIVALCRLQENNDISCARYWPEEGSEVYHIYEVHLVSEHIWCDDYLVRSFYLKNLRTGETRTVTQFHFLSWPQSGCPASAKALLEFRRKVNKSYRGRSCPIVVHSSNGAGRTGAYILLDLVLARMNKGAREIDIAATLEHLRDQRAGLVETRQQFEFVLMAVAEEVHAILKALPTNSQGEKRELDKDAVKEHDGEIEKNVKNTNNDNEKKSEK